MNITKQISLCSCIFAAFYLWWMANTPFDHEYQRMHQSLMATYIVIFFTSLYIYNEK